MRNSSFVATSALGLASLLTAQPGWSAPGDEPCAGVAPQLPITTSTLFGGIEGIASMAGGCAPEVLREDVDYSLDAVRFVAKRGVSARELKELEPRDEVSCQVACGIWKARVCGGEHAAAQMGTHMAMNREFHSRLIPAVLSCAGKIDGSPLGGSIVVSGAIDQVRDVARSSEASVHTVGKAFDIAQITVNGVVHSALKDWSKYVKSGAEADIPDFWNQMEDCLGAANLFTLSPQYGAQEIKGYQDEDESLSEGVADSLKEAGYDVGESKIKATIDRLLLGYHPTSAEQDGSEVPKRLRARIVSLFPKTAGLIPQPEPVLPGTQPAPPTPPTEDSPGDVAEDIGQSLMAIQLKQSAIRLLQLKRADHFNHLHVGMRTHLSGFSLAIKVDPGFHFGSLPKWPQGSRELPSDD